MRTLYDLKGRPVEVQYSVDAREMLESGEYTEEAIDHEAKAAANAAKAESDRLAQEAIDKEEAEKKAAADKAEADLKEAADKEAADKLKTEKSAGKLGKANGA